MTRQARERLLISLSLALLVGAAAWWYLSGEYEERQIYRPENTKLRTDTFHVAERWLRQQGHYAASLNHLQDLDTRLADNASLIISGALGQHNDLEARQLADWVERGGHLIARAPHRLPERPGEFDLNPFGLRSCQYCPIDQMDEQGEEEAAQDLEEIKPFRVVSIPDGPRLELWGQSLLRVPDQHAIDELWMDEMGQQAAVARYGYGDGRVTLIASTRWLDNTQLIYPDHARFLLYLVDRDRDMVYLQQRSQAGGLLGWLWAQAPWLWLIIALLVVLWIWSRMPRLGPMIDHSPAHSRQMRDHVLATARFDWRHNRGANLVSAMREERRLRLLKRFPDWRQLSAADRLQSLARLCPSQSRTRLAWYLSLDEPGNADELLEFVGLHEQLMHAL